MFANGRNPHIEKFCHSLLRTPHSFIMVHHLHARFFPFNLKNQELRRAIPNLKLLRHSQLPESRGDEAGEAGEAVAEAGALGGDVPAHEAFAGGAVHGAGVEPQAGLVAEFFLEDG